jgi:hypothetical protein
VESTLTSSLGERGIGKPGGRALGASNAAAASHGEWSRQRSSGLRREEKGKRIKQREEWRSLRHVRLGGKTRVGRPVSSISELLCIGTATGRTPCVKYFRTSMYRTVVLIDFTYTWGERNILFLYVKTHETNMFIISTRQADMVVNMSVIVLALSLQFTVLVVYAFLFLFCPCALATLIIN